MGHDVDHTSVRVADEEPAHAPVLVPEGQHDVDATCERGGMDIVDVRDLNLSTGASECGWIPSAAKLICAVGLDGEAIVTIQPMSITTSKPRRPT